MTRSDNGSMAVVSGAGAVPHKRRSSLLAGHFRPVLASIVQPFTIGWSAFIALKIVVLAKQVIDPEMPSSAFGIDPSGLRVATPPNLPPVVNGFDENAVEAALIINEAVGANITVLSVGSDFAMDVMKKPLSMGAEELILVDDPMVADLDAFAAQVAALDAVVTISNTTAHMAGGLGVTTLLMLDTIPIWYWRMEREDSPWDSSLKLFRQRRPSDWAEVIGRVEEAVKGILVDRH